MLRFSSDQMLAFESANWRRFVEQLAKRLSDDVPVLVARLGFPDLLRAVHHNANAAYNFGLREDDDIEAYVRYAARLGSGFPADIAVYWAGDIIQDDGFVLMSERMLYLDGQMRDHFLVAYEDYWVPRVAYERYASLLEDQRNKIEFTMSPISLLETLWPERTKLCEFNQLRDFCADCALLADGYGLTGHEVQTRYSAMAFIFGARFDMDPFHPWAAPVLQGPAAEPDVIMDRLEQVAVNQVILPMLAADQMPEVQT